MVLRKNAYLKNRNIYFRVWEYKVYYIMDLDLKIRSILRRHMKEERSFFILGPSLGSFDVAIVGAVI